MLSFVSMTIQQHRSDSTINGGWTCIQDWDRNMMKECSMNFSEVTWGLLTSQNNQIEIYLARWDTTFNQFFHSPVPRFFCIRAQYSGMWKMESSTVLLVNVESVSNETAFQDQRIMHDELDLANIYLPLLREYYKISIDQWTERSVINNIYTESIIVVSML